MSHLLPSKGRGQQRSTAASHQGATGKEKRGLKTGSDKRKIVNIKQNLQLFPVKVHRWLLKDFIARIASLF